MPMPQKIEEACRETSRQEQKKRGETSAKSLSKSQSQTTRNFLHPGDVRPRPSPKHAQAHPGVSPLQAIAHRNVSFQQLPRPLGLPPYHYDLSDNFPGIAKSISKSMTFHVVCDSGGVQDGEFQNNVAAQMIDIFTMARVRDRCSATTSEMSAISPG